jgi:transposase
MPRLTEVQRGQAIALLMQGQRQQVALQFGVNVSIIERLVRRLRDTGRVVDHPRRGCLLITTPRQDRAIHFAHLRNSHVTATETALTMVGNHNRHFHPKTVRNQLREFGLRAHRPYIGFPLTRERRARRMAWLAAHGPRQFPMRQWRQVFFTDESRFTLFRPDSRRRGERFADACVLESDRFGGGSVMVWGGISHGLKSLLIAIAGYLTGVRYRDEILRPVAVPFVQQHHLILSRFSRQS